VRKFWVTALVKPGTLFCGLIGLNLEPIEHVLPESQLSVKSQTSDILP